MKYPFPQPSCSRKSNAWVWKACQGKTRVKRINDDLWREMGRKHQCFDMFWQSTSSRFLYVCCIQPIWRCFECSNPMDRLTDLAEKNGYASMIIYVHNMLHCWAGRKGWNLQSLFFDIGCSVYTNFGGCITIPKPKINPVCFRSFFIASFLVGQSKENILKLITWLISHT